MEVSGQLHSSAALRRGMNTRYTLERKLDQMARRKNTRPYRDSSPGRPAHSLVTTLTELARLLQNMRMSWINWQLSGNSNSCGWKYWTKIHSRYILQLLNKLHIKALDFFFQFKFIHNYTPTVSFKKEELCYLYFYKLVSEISNYLW
jgi:hypothetical protein